MGTLLLAAGANAQDATVNVGNATLSIGSGTAILTLPDVASMMVHRNGLNQVDQRFKLSEDFDREIGWNVNGTLTIPQGTGTALLIAGFSAHIDGKHSETCVAQTGQQVCNLEPLVDVPGIRQEAGSDGPGYEMYSYAERDVHQWGVSTEMKQWLTPSISGATQAPPQRYFSLGLDVRGIDQDIEVDFTSNSPTFPNGLVTYDEDLDARYYGAYVAYGGEMPTLPFGGLWKAWGLKSKFRLQGGVYYATADYSGTLVDRAPPFPTLSSLLGANPASALTLSEDEIAFIGRLTLETSKRINRRTTLYLTSDYEYYSWVPEMLYNQQDVYPAFPAMNLGEQVGTIIDSDDAFSFRSSLRLTIGLGPQELYE